MLYKRSLLTVCILLILLVGLVPITTAQEPVEATIAPDLLNVREAPSTNSDIVTQLPRGTTVVVSGRNDRAQNSESWVFVTPEGGSAAGWVQTQYLLFPDNYNVGVLPVISAQGTSSAAPPTNTTESTTTTTTTNTVPTGAANGVTNDFANFRTGPELTFDVIRQLRVGEPLILLGRNGNGVWINVQHEGDTGWIFYALIDSEVALNSLPVVGADGAPPVTTAPVEPSTTGDSETTTSAAPITTGGAAPPQMALSVRPDTLPIEGDGRLNRYDDLGFALVYCVDGNGYTNTGSYANGGIVVFHTQGSQTVFFASEAEINAAGSNPPGGRLIKLQGGYALYRLEEGLFLLTGEDFRGEDFSFRWQNCQIGQKVG